MGSICSVERVREKALRGLKADEITGLCSSLVKAPSENPPGDVRLAAEVAMSWLSEKGHRYEAHEPEDGRINLVSRSGEGRPRLMLMGHLDVVPAGDKARWSFDPFCGDIKNDKVLGRGATDMKGGVACIMAVYHALSGLLEELGGSLVLALVCDEETGGRMGAGWLAEQGIFGGVDACIIAEPTSPHVAVLGERGVCWVRLRARGRPGHGSVPSLGLNAIELAMRALDRLKGIEETTVEAPEDVKAIIEEMDELVKGDLLGLGLKRSLAYVDACGRFTMNIGLIRGGTKVNVVPEACEVEVDIRVPHGSSTRETLSLVEKLVSWPPGRIEVEPINQVEPTFTSPSERICEALDEAVEAVVGGRPVHALMPATTDAHHLRARGIPTAIYGPGLIHLAHAYDEYVPVKHLELVSRAICLTAIGFLSRASRA